MPSCIHQTFRGEKPWMPVEANGAPLSVRIASGKPTSRKSARNPGCARAVFTDGSPRQHLPAEMIGHGQGIAVLSIARLELPFEIGGPHMIRAVGLHRGRAWVGPRAAAPILSEQVVTLEDVVDG